MEKEVAGICQEKEKGKQHAILELAIKKKKKKKKSWIYKKENNNTNLKEKDSN